MSWNKQFFTFNGITASDLGEYIPVKVVTGATGNYVTKAATTTDDVVGVSLASAATYGHEVAVQFHGIAKMICGASIGAGARVAIASTNGAVGPIGLSGMGAASAAAVFSVGRSLEAHAAGDYMPVLLDFTEVA